MLLFLFINRIIIYLYTYTKNSKVTMSNILNTFANKALSSILRQIAEENQEYRLLPRTDITNLDQNIQIPDDLGEFYISMRFEKYQRRSIKQSPRYVPVTAIRLPLPEELNDNLSINYSTENLGTLIGSGLETIDTMGSKGTFTPEAGQAFAESVAAGLGAFRNRILNFQNRFTGLNARAAIEAYSGLTFNEYQVVLFKSPNFKKHRFSWRLVPKNEKESNSIANLIKLFKFCASPGLLGQTGFLFEFPELLRVSLHPQTEYLYEFKPCVVENISVNYAPNGLSFYKSTKAPVAVDFSISLQEVELWTKRDFEMAGVSTSQIVNT